MTYDQNPENETDVAKSVTDENNYTLRNGRQNRGNEAPGA